MLNSSKKTHGSASNLQVLDSGANDTLEYRIQAVEKALPSAAPTADRPSTMATAREIGMATKEAITALKWVLAILIVVALVTKRMDIEALKSLNLAKLLGA